MLTITGGKLTTWRRMAKLTVDRLVQRDARDAPCHTHEIPLGQAISAEELPRVEGVPEAIRCPGRPVRLCALTRCSRSRGRKSRPPELAQPIVPGLPDLLAEVVARRPSRAGAHHRGCAAAPHAAWGCWPRGSWAGWAIRSIAWPACWRASSAGTMHALSGRSSGSRPKPTPRVTVRTASLRGDRFGSGAARGGFARGSPAGVSPAGTSANGMSQPGVSPA